MRVGFRSLMLGRVTWGTMVVSACAPAGQPGDPQALSANQAWVQHACAPDTFDPSAWPTYEYRGIRIAVPAPYKQTSTNPEYLFVRTPRGTMSIWRHREARYEFDALYKQVHPGQVSCTVNYGGLPAEVVAWHDRGAFLTAIRVAPTSIGESDRWLIGVVRSRELSDATMLRHVLRTMTLTPSRGER